MIIDTFDKELEEIGVQVDLSIESADEHLNQRLGKGEAESVTLSVKSHDNNDQRSEVFEHTECLIFTGILFVCAITAIV